MNGLFVGPAIFGAHIEFARFDGHKFHSDARGQIEGQLAIGRGGGKLGRGLRHDFF